MSTYINAKVITNYKIADTQVLTNSSHKNLGIIISSDLSWDQHYKNIIPKTYRMLGLLHRSFSKHQTVTAKRTLYISLVRFRLYLINMLRIIMKFIYLFLFTFIVMLYTAQVLKVCRAPGPTACSKTLAT